MDKPGLNFNLEATEHANETIERLEKLIHEIARENVKAVQSCLQEGYVSAPLMSNLEGLTTVLSEAINFIEVVDLQYHLDRKHREGK